MRRKTIIITLYLLTVSLCGFSQMGKLFDADMQLSSSFTNQVYIDRDGFLWVVTRNGLNKYDGYQFHILKKENSQSNGMSSNYVNCMIQDRVSGLFYMGMYGAFQTYDGTSFSDVEVRDLDNNVVPCYMTCFLQRANNDVLAGTSGHGLLVVTDKKHAHQAKGPLSKIHTVNGMVEDKEGHVWIVSADMGVIEYDGKNIKRYLQNEVLPTVRCITKDDKDNIYVGTSNNGVYVLRREARKEFTHIDYTSGKPIYTLYTNRTGQLIIGYDGHGIGIYDPQTGSMTDNPYFSREVDLAHGKVSSIIEDSSGNVWIGLFQKGIYMQPGKTMPFGYMGYKLGAQNIIGTACVVSTLIDSKGQTWIGTDKDGLYCLKSRTNVTHYAPSANFPSTIMSIAESSDGRIWIGSYMEGFGWLDPQSKSYHKYSDSRFNAISAFSMRSTPNNLWIATMGQGLLQLNLNENSLKAHAVKEGIPHDSTANNIVNNYISQISVSPDGNRIYAATTMGLCCYDITKNSWLSTFGKNCLNYGTPTRVAREFYGQIWIGTNDGLYRYNPKDKSFQLLTMDKGLADNGISSIEQDKQGRLWISTDHGLCCYNPQNELTLNYFIDNGLQSNEFSDGASSVSPDGQLLFGGVAGITWFYPSSIRQIRWNATVRLTAFSLNGEHVNPSTRSDGYQVTDTAVIASNRFDLSYHDNSFTIQLSTLTYDSPEHITYLYSINDESFVRLQPGLNEITFSHLSPGTYRFKVKAEHNGYETATREFTVVIHAPWYKTGWAYLFYILLTAFGIWWYLRTRKRKEQDRLKLQEHIHAEEMSEAKVRFFMNISHEIRTPLTLIITPLLSLMKEDNDPHRKSVYETIKRNAERILHLINQLMDLRKIDKGMMQMRMQETDLIDFVKDIYTLFGYQAQTKHITLNYEYDTDHLPVWIDKRNFDKVIMNILSNAFKFTSPGGEINIRVSHNDQNATIAISDNGENIPPDKIDKIFERFYQTTSGINERNIGTGIGLDLTRSLVELHYGVITAKNLKKGCEFTVSIPLGNEHLKPEEMIDGQEQEVQPEEHLLGVVQDDGQITEEEPVVKSPNEKPTIVVVEDDDEIRNFLTEELQKDYEVKAFLHGKQALPEIYRIMPDIVLSDIMMPEMDGNALCTQLKMNPMTNHIPVILLTAKNRDEDKLEGLETGADAYIVKPFNMDILRRTIVNHINMSRLMKMKYGKRDQLEEQVEDVKMKSPDEKLLARVMATVNKHLNNSDLSVDMIAEEVGISRVHLHRKMKELTGQTPHDFIRSIRLKQAANLLSTRNMNITEVVYACGFSNAASFSTMFKNVYGMSPREYMRSQQKENKKKS